MAVLWTWKGYADRRIHDGVHFAYCHSITMDPGFVLGYRHAFALQAGHKHIHKRVVFVQFGYLHMADAGPIPQQVELGSFCDFWSYIATMDSSAVCTSFEGAISPLIPLYVAISRFHARPIPLLLLAICPSFM